MSAVYDITRMHDRVAIIRLGGGPAQVDELDLASAQRLRDRLDKALREALAAPRMLPWWGRPKEAA